MYQETSDSIKNSTDLPANVFLERIREEWSSTYNDVENELKLIESKDKKEDVYVSTVKGGENILTLR